MKIDEHNPATAPGAPVEAGEAMARAALRPLPQTVP